MQTVTATNRAIARTALYKIPNKKETAGQQSPF